MAQQKLNIIYIMSDDHDMKAISAYDRTLIRTPNIDRLAVEGMLFKNAFVGNSICSPARATLLTGQHSHLNGVRDNRIRFDSSKLTLPKILQAAGYQTAIVGKWHLHSYPTGFDYWKILPGQGQYFEPAFISMNGDTARIQGYATEVITDEAIAWLERRHHDKPFLLLLHHKAPHRYFFPPLRYIRQFQDKRFPLPPTLHVDTRARGTAWRSQRMSILRDMQLSSDLKVDPAALAGIPALMPDAQERQYYQAIMNRIPEKQRKEIAAIYAKRGEALQRLKPDARQLLELKYQWYMQDYLACVASIDESVGRVLDYLDRSGLARNTVVIYTSDQGMYLGENGWFDKRFMYDKSMRTPLLIRWPGSRPGKTGALVQNIDFAPTILDAAGVAVPRDMQGQSLKPLLFSSGMFSRDHLYYHYYEFGRDHSVLPHLGVRGRRYKLIYFYTVNEWEFYDLQQDPAELKNLIHSSRHQAIIREYRTVLKALRTKYEDTEPAGELR